MKNYLVVLGSVFALTAPNMANADEYDLSQYKTVAVQPVLASSNTPGLFESQLAAHAASLTYSDAQAKAASTGSLGLLDRESSGFGFAGKAGKADVAMLLIGTTIGVLPTALKVQPAGVKQRVNALRNIVSKLEGKVDADVYKGLTLVLQAADTGDFALTTKAVLLTMVAATNAIKKGNERAHGYLASGLLASLATTWAAGGVSNKSLANMAGPLIVLLEEDAVMGGADRGVAAQLKVIAAELEKPKPQLAAVMAAIKTLDATKAD